MIGRNESIVKKKLFVFIAAFLVSLSVLASVVTAETGDTSANRAGMISSLMDLIKSANKTEPALPTASPLPTEAPQETAPPKDDNIYIKVYFHREGVIKSIALDEYIQGVLYGEVPETYHAEALKAQAIAARSYTVYRINHYASHDNGADVCTDYTHCQAWTAAENGIYPDSIRSAVAETRHMIGTYEGKCINALYFSNSGGYTEAIENVWGGAPYPYLTSVESPGEAGNYDFCNVKYFTAEEFVSKICAYSGITECNEDDAVSNISKIKRSESGRVLSAEIAGTTFTGQQLRAMFGTLSANIYFKRVNEDAVAVVSLGYGHGVGMSQCGAQAMAESGADCETILKHYYKGIELEQYA